MVLVNEQNLLKSKHRITNAVIHNYSNFHLVPKKRLLSWSLSQDNSTWPGRRASAPFLLS